MMPTVLIRNKSKRKLKIIITFLLLFVLTFLLANNLIELLTGLKKKRPFSRSNLFLIRKFDLTNANREIIENKKELKYYEKLKCQRSAKYFVEVNLCYQTDDESAESIAIRKYGISNGFVVDQLTEDLLKCGGNCAFMDIGAGYGQYTLFAAKLGKQVLAFEPYKPNLLRIHKSCQTDTKRLQLEERIVLIENVIPYNESNKFVQLIESNSSSGAFRLDFISAKSNQTARIRTISYDELVNLMPKRSNNEHYKNLILRVNLNNGLRTVGFNSNSSQKLFDKFDIKSIYMSWAKMVEDDLEDSLSLKYQIDAVLTRKMIDFLLNRNFLPLEIQTNGLLNAKEWDSWPDHVVWKKKGF